MLVQLEFDAQRADYARGRRKTIVLGGAAVALTAGAFFAASQDLEPTLASDVMGLGGVIAAVTAINTGYKTRIASINIDAIKVDLDAALARPQIQEAIAARMTPVSIPDVLQMGLHFPGAPSEQ